MAVSKQDLIREKLQTKVFDVIGKSVTLINKSSPTYNTRGDLISAVSTSSTITIVPYDITSDKRLFETWGNVNEGQMDVAIPYDITVGYDDILTIEGTNYLIKEVSPNYLPDNVVTIVRVYEEQA